MNLRKILSVACCILIVNSATAQGYLGDKNAFITRNLRESSYRLDTSASAIVLYEKKECILTSKSPVASTTVTRIIKILKSSGIKYADVELNTYHALDHFSKILKVSGTTYNLQNGGVTETPLSDDNKSKDKFGAHIKEEKFTMPDVKVGSVIEYTYEIDRDASRNFCTWTVNGDIPKLYSELELTVSKAYDVVVVSQGLIPFVRNVDEENDSVNLAYMTSDETGDATTTRWVRKFIFAIDDEPYVNDIDNYRGSMDIYIQGIIRGRQETMFGNNWDKINTELYRDDHFYKAITVNNQQVLGKTSTMTQGDTSELVKANKIYAFVRDSMTANNQSGIYVKNYPGTVLVQRGGSPSEINMLLVTMLRQVGIECSPVILSTRENGRVTKAFPDLQEFNYTICQATIGGKLYYLDAAQKYLPLGMLPLKCYNGFARVVNADGDSISLDRDIPLEKSFIKMVTSNNNVDNYTVDFELHFDDYKAIALREQWNRDSKEIKAYINALLKGSSFEFKDASSNVDNLTNVGKPLVLSFSAHLPWPSDAGIIYLNPYVVTSFRENPFTSTVRNFPVELPSRYNLSYYCKLQLPAGYALDDTLTPLSLQYDNDARYQEVTTYDKATNIISINANMKINKTFFRTNEYPFLKEFLDKKVAQQQNNLVIKKTL